jgi:hypothetical protein
MQGQKHAIPEPAEADEAAEPRTAAHGLGLYRPPGDTESTDGSADVVPATPRRLTLPEMLLNKILWRYLHMSRNRGLDYVWAEEADLATEMGRHVRSVQRYLLGLQQKGRWHRQRTQTGNHYRPCSHATTVAGRSDKDVVSDPTTVSCALNKEKKIREEAKDWRPLAEYFCARWQERYADAFPFNANRRSNGDAISTVLSAANRDPDKAKRIISAYLDDPDQWIVANKHPLPYLAKNVHRFLGGGEPSINENGCYMQPRRVGSKDARVAMGWEQAISPTNADKEGADA